MKLHFECAMGCSGDMMMAALYELLPDKEAFRERMRRLSLPGVVLNYTASEKCGITGTHITVTVGGFEEKSEDVNLGTGDSEHSEHSKHSEHKATASIGTQVNAQTIAQVGNQTSNLASTQINAHSHNEASAQANSQKRIINIRASSAVSDKHAHLHKHIETSTPYTHEQLHSHEHEHEHEHSHKHEHEHSGNHEFEHKHDHSNEHDDEHTHAHGHEHNHGSGHEHGYNHDNDHSHEHTSDHNHNHTHDHTHSPGHNHYSYNEIIKLIRSLSLPENVLNDALGVYQILGEAESFVHGVALSEIHLHEVGRLDAVADIVGCCLLMNMLGITKVTASPVHVGSGSVRCEHGILPVPAPAAAEILKGIPIYGGSIRGELCTPTGAALLKRFVTDFGPMPPLTVVNIGCGMGSKDFEAANCLRAFLCEEDANDGGEHDTVYEISCNLDDMTPEAIGAAFDILLENGALDVFATPIMMKKSRPAVMLTCLCAEELRDNLSRLMLKHTSTLGIRISSHRRDVLKRTVQTVSTKYGTIRIKHAHGFGTIKTKPEYDDVLDAAKKHSIPFSIVYDAAMGTALDSTLDTVNPA